jgi:HAD superfamily hydrolase (TIGR01459 family)
MPYEGRATAPSLIFPRMSITPPTSPPPFSRHFAELAAGYDVLLSDVWGVVHNGVAATVESCEALMRFRRQGGTVVLITNAPRPGDVVMGFLDKLAVPRAAYDGIVSSGDVTRAMIAQRTGQRVFHLGPERDLPIFDGLGVELAPLERADFVVCSGLFDDTTETPESYTGLIAAMLARKLTMICANPDIVVERGAHLVYCAGAIADRYALAGGDVLFAGKPYRPIYEQAIAAAQASRPQASRAQPIDQRRVLAIGDSVRTDLKGAAAFGIDCLFITAGIHAEELGGRDSPDAGAVDGIFAAAGVYPKAVMRRLEW